MNSWAAAVSEAKARELTDPTLERIRALIGRAEATELLGITGLIPQTFAELFPAGARIDWLLVR